MVDFLKANPAFSMHDVMWTLSVPFVKIMNIDATQVHYLSEKQAKKIKTKKAAVRIDDPMQLLNDTGAPIFQ